MTTRNKILKQLDETLELPPLPEILVKLEKCIKDPNSDISDVIRVIKTEPVLTARLVKLANSVFFGGGREKAETLDSAVLRLGIKMVLDLAYTLNLPILFEKFKGFDQLRFWKHSFAVAMLSHSLAQKKISSKEEQELSYLAGLMHDMGILVFCSLVNEKYFEFLQDANESKEPIENLEDKRFGVNHAVLGARFIEKNWNLPAKVCEVIEQHHNTYPKAGEPWRIAQIVYISNKLANDQILSHGIHEKSTNAKDDDFYLNTLEISKQELEKLIEETKENILKAEEILKI